MKTLTNPFIWAATLILAAIITLTSGCASTAEKPAFAAIAFHTLRDTQTVVDGAMKIYANRCVQGQVTADNQAKVDTAHATYRKAFREAVLLAQLDYSKLTPDNVEVLSTALLKLIASL